MDQAKATYESPAIETVGSLHALTQTVKAINPASDGYYLGVQGEPGTNPLGS
jgi:hypothetical protein